MTSLRDRLWDLWEDAKERWRVYVARQRQGPGWILTVSHPGSLLFNLTILAAVKGALEHVPCELVVDQNNILDFAAEWSREDSLAHVRGDAAGAWRIFCHRLRKIGGSSEAIVSVHEIQPVRKIKVFMMGDASAVQLRLSDYTEELPPLGDRPPMGR